MREFKKILTIIIILFVMPISGASWAQTSSSLPEGFCYLTDVVPGIIIDLRYKTNNNFLGRPVNGYKDAQCIITIPAAKALLNVQQELNKMGLGLKVFDAYRPQKAVNDFVEWAKNLKDTKMKKEYYPDILKQNLFKDGYIADHSGHSRGSTIDLTVVGYDKKGKATELNMGSNFDFFGKKSHPDYKDIPYQARANRLLLRSLMIQNGFIPIKEEWWHFTINNEPYPSTYFDFPMQ